MKFYLESARDLEPYDDLKTNRLMRKYWQKIEKETDAKVALEDARLEGSQHKTKSSLKSKHRTMLIKPKTDDYLKAIATIYGTSVNEIINKALDGYVAEKLQDPDIGDKIRLLQEIQIKDKRY